MNPFESSQFKSIDCSNILDEFKKGEKITLYSLYENNKNKEFLISVLWLKLCDFLGTNKSYYLDSFSKKIKIMNLIDIELLTKNLYSKSVSNKTWENTMNNLNLVYKNTDFKLVHELNRFSFPMSCMKFISPSIKQSIEKNRSLNNCISSICSHYKTKENINKREIEKLVWVGIKEHALSFGHDFTFDYTEPILTWGQNDLNWDKNTKTIITIKVNDSLNFNSNNEYSLYCISSVGINEKLKDSFDKYSITFDKSGIYYFNNPKYPEMELRLNVIDPLKKIHWNSGIYTIFISIDKSLEITCDDKKTILLTDSTFTKGKVIVKDIKKHVIDFDAEGTFYFMDSIHPDKSRLTVIVSEKCKNNLPKADYTKSFIKDYNEWIKKDCILKYFYYNTLGIISKGNEIIKESSEYLFNLISEMKDLRDLLTTSIIILEEKYDYILVEYKANSIHKYKLLPKELNQVKKDVYLLKCLLNDIGSELLSKAIPPCENTKESDVEFRVLTTWYQIDQDYALIALIESLNNKKIDEYILQQALANRIANNPTLKDKLTHYIHTFRY